MTKVEAKRLVLHVMATQLSEQGVCLNAVWPTAADDGGDRPVADVERIQEAARILVREWSRRARKGREAP